LAFPVRRARHDELAIGLQRQPETVDAQLYPDRRGHQPFRAERRIEHARLIVAREPELRAGKRRNIARRDELAVGLHDERKGRREGFAEGRRHAASVAKARVEVARGCPGRGRDERECQRDATPNETTADQRKTHRHSAVPSHLTWVPWWAVGCHDILDPPSSHVQYR
jgi:hypothetical protein